MSKKIYIGNLSFTTTEETLKNLFSNYGNVLSVNIIYDKITNQSKGFGFLEIEDDSDASTAIGTLNGKTLDGRRLRVNFADDNQKDKRNGYSNFSKSGLY